MALNFQGRVLHLPLHLVKPGQPARARATEKLQELAASITEVGILQPLTVRKNGDHYIVVSGNRRLAAAKMVGLSRVPCILTEVGETDGELLSLSENLQREDLHYFEEAELLRKYLTKSGLTQMEAAKKLGRSQSAIANKIRLLQHSTRVRETLRELGLSERHARELLRVEGESERLQVAVALAEKRYSIQQAEKYIDTYLQNHRAANSRRMRLRDTRLFLQRLDQDTALLRHMGIAAEMDKREDGEEIVLTVRLPNCGE